MYFQGWRIYQEFLIENSKSRIGRLSADCKYDGGLEDLLVIVKKSLEIKGRERIGLEDIVSYSCLRGSHLRSYANAM